MSSMSDTMTPTGLFAPLPDPFLVATRGALSPCLTEAASIMSLSVRQYRAIGQRALSDASRTATSSELIHALTRNQTFSREATHSSLLVRPKAPIVFSTASSHDSA